MVLRFGNVLFEPLWNSALIDHVQITVAETLGVGSRGGYYDTAGALRDMVQNHMLQLLCLVAMEPPDSYDANAIRDEKLKVLKALKPIAGDDAESCTVRGQYRAGACDGDAVPGYLRGDRRRARASPRPSWRSRPRSRNWRWAGVPFYLRTGKRLPAAHVGDRRRLQAGPALDLSEGRRRARAEPPGAAPAAGRGRQAMDHDQGSRPRRHAASATCRST